MTLEETRERIDAVDAQLLALFNERLDLAADVAAAKRAMGKAIYDPARERQKLYGLAQAAEDTRQAQTVSFFSLLMSMSKAEQARLLSRNDPASPSHSVRAAFEQVGCERMT